MSKEYKKFLIYSMTSIAVCILIMAALAMLIPHKYVFVAIIAIVIIIVSWTVFMAKLISVYAMHNSSENQMETKGEKQQEQINQDQNTGNKE